MVSFALASSFSVSGVEHHVPGAAGRMAAAAGRAWTRVSRRACGAAENVELSKGRRGYQGRHDA
eukprot:11552715-Prorocentrum_lima.AAC.1